MNNANPRQRAQRAATRQRLIDGAMAIFSNRGYAEATTEDILIEAGVSRSTFYGHFSGKGAIIAALADAFAPEWLPLADELAAMPEMTLTTVTDWCRKLAVVYRANSATCVILTEAAAIDTSLYWKLADHRSQLIDKLADGNPAFAHLKDDPTARLHAALTFSQLDHACYFLAVRHWAHDHGTGVAMMAAPLWQFLQSQMR